jgi:hypothetical protein
VRSVEDRERIVADDVQAPGDREGDRGVADGHAEDRLRGRDGRRQVGLLVARRVNAG